MRDSLSLSCPLLAFAGLLLAGAVAQPAPAQTPAATVKDDGGTVVLQSFFEGQLFAPGVFNSGPIPATGSGTRMMWWPKKAAFRAGRVGLNKDGTQWNAGKVGDYSVALGVDTKASGFGAVALGDRTTASDNKAVAMGTGTNASASSATAMGNGTAASGVNTTAMGFQTTASALNATSMGKKTTAATRSSLSIGVCNDKNRGNDDGDPTTGPLFVVGNGTFSSGSCTHSDALILDQNGNLEATGSFVLPDGTVLDGSEDLEGVPTNSNGASEVSNNDGFIATGTFDSGSIPTSGSGTRMMWYPNKAAFRAGRVGNFKDGTQWDASKVGDYSVAFGVDTKADGLAAAAIGGQTIAATDYSLSVGECNFANTSADNTLFVVGNGVFDTVNDVCLPSDALVLDRDAGLLVNGRLGTGSIPASGGGTRMMWYPGDAALRAGEVTGTEWNDGNVGQHSVAFGKNTTASGDKSFAAGDNAEATGSKSFAAGLDVTATNVEAVAMGKNADATGTQAVAIGQNADADGSSATAFGSNTTASGVGALAANRDTDAGADAATALGRRTEADTPHSLSVGQCNNANSTDDKTLFVVGNGSLSSGTCLVSDAFTVDESGNATASSHDTFSDRRLKTDIEPLGTDILQKLGKVRPVRYKFKNQRRHPSGEQIGLIAQDVRKEFPSLVTKGSGGYLSLAYPKLTAVLLKGLQEQQAQLDAKQAQIDALRARVEQIETLRQRVARLEGRASGSLWAGLPGSNLLLALLLGGLLGAALLRIRRS